MDEREKKKCIFTTILNSCPGVEKSFSQKHLSDYCVGDMIQSAKTEAMDLPLTSKVRVVNYHLHTNIKKAAIHPIPSNQR